MPDHLPPYPDDHAPRAQTQAHHAPAPAPARSPQPTAPLRAPAGRSSIDAQTRTLAQQPSRRAQDAALVARVLTLRYMADMADYGPDAVLDAVMDALTIAAQE